SLYDNRKVARTIKSLFFSLRLQLDRKLRRCLGPRKPDAIICTHALACAALALEKERGLLPVPLVGVLTDFGVHDYWISPHVDLYLVPNHSVGRELSRRGVQGSRIRVTGIPIHPKFRRPLAAAQARRKFGLRPDRPTVLVSGGSKGLGPIRDAVLRLLADIPELQVVVICGSN